MLREHPLTVISVLLSPSGGSLSPEDLQKTLRTAMEIVEGSIPGDRGVVLSRLSPGKDKGMVFLILCIGLAETESLARKIEADLAEPEDLKYGDIETSVSRDLLDIRSLIDNAPEEGVADMVAEMVNELLCIDTPGREDYACKRARS
jgi:hypothetical protein